MFRVLLLVLTVRRVWDQVQGVGLRELTFGRLKGLNEPPDSPSKRAGLAKEIPKSKSFSHPHMQYHTVNFTKLAQSPSRNSVIEQKKTSPPPPDKVLRRCNSETFFHSWDYAPIKEKEEKKPRHHEKSKPKESENKPESEEDSVSTMISSRLLVEFSSGEEDAYEELGWVQYLQETMASEKVTYRIDANNKKCIKAATPDFFVKSIVALDPEEIPDAEEFVDIIILTHPIWIESTELFEKLHQLYQPSYVR